MMKRKLLLVGLPLLLFSVACKKKPVSARTAAEAQGSQPIGNAFAVKSAIAIYDAPAPRAKAIGTLPIGNKVEIFATHVPDQKEPEKAFWYKVKYSPASAAVDKPAMPVEGFVSEREEVLRQNFLVFRARGEESEWREDEKGNNVEVKGQAGAMVVTGLKLRKNPALNGQVIRTLQNGEVLKILEISDGMTEIDDKKAPWYLASDEAGTTGYVFGGYLVTGIYDRLGGLRDAGFQFTRGWVTLASEVKAYRSPEGKEPPSANGGLGEVPFKDWKIPQGTLLRVDAEVTRTPEKRYRAVVTRGRADDEFYQKFEVYLPKARGKFIKDYFEISKSKPHTIDMKIAEAVNRYLGGDMNLQCTNVASFDAGAGDQVRHMISVTTATGPESETYEHAGKKGCRDVLTDVALLLEEKDGAFVMLGKVGVDDVNFTDLDGDGIPELISEHSHPRGGYALSIYGLKNNRLSPLFVWNGDRIGCITMSFDGKQIVIDQEGYYKERMSAGEKFDECKVDAADLRERYKGLPFSAGTKLPYYAHVEKGALVQTPYTP